MSDHHTPGPWIAEPYSTLFHVFAAGHRVMVCDSNATAGLSEHVEHVARMRGVGAGLTEAEQEANAHLIAAAPDLLRACRAVAGMAVAWEALTPGDIEEVTAAIAKAEGR